MKITDCPRNADFSQKRLGNRMSVVKILLIASEETLEYNNTFPYGTREHKNMGGRGRKAKGGLLL